MAKFTVFFNGECINTYEMNEPVVSIGRLPENSISIANMGISRRHAKIEEDTDRKYIISDLNSLNGTYVNGKRIKKGNIYSGDKITIGKYTILYEDLNNQHSSENVENVKNVDVSSAVQDNEVQTIQNISDHIIETSENGFTNEVDFSQPPTYTDNPVVAEDAAAGDNIYLTDEPILNDADLQKTSNEAVFIETNKHVVYKLDKAYMTMGSGDNDDIFVSGFLISEGQVSIEKNEDGYIICANKFIGKFKINGKSAKTHLLQHKDRIEIGSSTFRYMENG